MATAKEKEAPAPSLVPVISENVQTIWLQAYEQSDGGPRVAAKRLDICILPGLNYKDAADLGRCGPLGSLNTRLSVRDPGELEPHRQQELAAMTTSREALRQWRALESNPATIAMLDERLGRDGKAAG